jgi:hypothetical protein
MQLFGTAPGGMQLAKAKLGGVFNMGGAAVANYVSILEPLPAAPGSTFSRAGEQPRRQLIGQLDGLCAA